MEEGFSSLMIEKATESSLSRSCLNNLGERVCHVSSTVVITFRAVAEMGSRQLNGYKLPQSEVLPEKEKFRSLRREPWAKSFKMNKI